MAMGRGGLIILGLGVIIEPIFFTPYALLIGINQKNQTLIWTWTRLFEAFGVPKAMHDLDLNLKYFQHNYFKHFIFSKVNIV